MQTRIGVGGQSSSQEGREGHEGPDHCGGGRGDKLTRLKAAECVRTIRENNSQIWQ